MSGCVDRMGSATRGLRVFDRLVAFDVNDGPVAGIAFCADSKDAVFFRLEAWDNQQKVRVFSVAPLSSDEATLLVQDLASVETPRWPEWWLKAAASTREARATIDEAVNRATGQAGPVTWIGTTTDLLTGFSKVAYVTDGVVRQRVEKLSRRAAHAEVSDGSFAEWIKFVDDYALSGRSE